MLALFITVFLLSITTVSSSGTQMHSARGVVLQSTNHLGEEELWLHYGKWYALQVRVPRLGESGMHYQQITDGRHFLQGVYENRDSLMDCDTSKDKDEVKRLMGDFHAKETATGKHHHSTGIESSHASNVSMWEVHSHKDLDPMALRLLDVSNFRQKCKLLHRRLRKSLQQSQVTGEMIRRNRRNAFQRLQGEEMAEIKSELPIRKSKKTRPATSDRSSRVKRGFIYPGTNWCGNGNTALDFHDLGENVATDKCCRGHDHCPYTINGFSSRYNLFNYRFHTLSHCQCDEIFRSCLRSAANSVADMVGNVFFNVVGMDCFTLKKIQVCTRRSWWGRCDEYGDDYEAELSEPFRY